jgi:hypothetical protein
MSCCWPEIEPERGERRAERIGHILLLARNREAIARRQAHGLDDLLHVVADVARSAPLGGRVERDAALQLLALHDLRARGLDDLGHLAQRHQPRLSVRTHAR